MLTFWGFGYPGGKGAETSLPPREERFPVAVEARVPRRGEGDDVSPEDSRGGPHDRPDYAKVKVAFGKGAPKRLEELIQRIREKELSFSDFQSQLETLFGTLTASELSQAAMEKYQVDFGAMSDAKFRDFLVSHITDLKKELEDTEAQEARVEVLWHATHAELEEEERRRREKEKEERRHETLVFNPISNLHDSAEYVLDLKLPFRERQ
jgi:hypothetical protein